MQSVLLVDPVHTGFGFKRAVRDLGLGVVSVYTLPLDVLRRRVAGHLAGDDEAIFSNDVEEVLERLPQGVVGVIPASEPSISLGDALAARLGLPGNDPALSSSRRNKIAMRRRARERRISVPPFEVVDSAQGVLAAATRIGYPAIVKPPTSVGAHGVTLLSDPASAEAFAGRHSTTPFRDAFGGEVVHWLVESYIRGRELSVNFVSFDGVHRLVDVWEYRQPGSDDYDQPYWDVLQLGAEDADWARAAEFVRSALDAFGVRYGSSHTEVKCTADGVFLIELASRMTGGPTPRCWLENGSFDPYRDTTLAFCGRRPEVMDDGPTFTSAFGVSAIRNDGPDGRLVRIEGLDEITVLPGVKCVSIHRSPGDLVPKTHDMDSIAGVVFISGCDRASVLETMRTVRLHLRLELRR
jgi:biotin carboxylase